MIFLKKKEKKQKLLLFKEMKPQLLKLNLYQPLPEQIEKTRRGMWSRCATFAAAAKGIIFLAEFHVPGLAPGLVRTGG